MQRYARRLCSFSHAGRSQQNQYHQSAPLQPCTLRSELSLSWIMVSILQMLLLDEAFVVTVEQLRFDSLHSFDGYSHNNQQ